jgi:gamma-glutamylputrescine oxidase
MDIDVPVWDDGRWDPFPQLRGVVRADACVIGLGGSGLACIDQLLELGASVVGIEADSVAAGAAGRNGGFLVAGSYHFYHDAVARYGRSRALRIYQSTLEQIDRIAGETPGAVRRTGSLRIATSSEELADCDAQLDAMRADGLDVEPYDGPEGLGLLLPRDAAFNPLLRCRLLARDVARRGAVLHEETRALHVESGVVVTAHGRVECEHVFVAADGGLVRLFPDLADRLRVARLQMLATAPTDEVRVPRPVYYRYGYEYWQQLPDHRIALGGFRDLAGAAEWTESTAPSSAVQDALERHLRDVIGVSAPITHRWAASVSFTDDGLPLIEEARPGVWALGGYSGTGNVIGAICGRAAARLARLGDASLAEPFLRAGYRRPSSTRSM